MASCVITGNVDRSQQGKIRGTNNGLSERSLLQLLFKMNGGKPGRRHSGGVSRAPTARELIGIINEAEKIIVIKTKLGIRVRASR